jgi:hypothetical protein
MAVTDACGLDNGLTLIATTRLSILVVEKLKVVHKMEGLEHLLLKLSPLTGSCFVAATNKESIDVFDMERDSEPIAGAASFCQFASIAADCHRWLSIPVVENFRVAHKVEGLETLLLKLSPLTGSCFVVATSKESIDFFLHGARLKAIRRCGLSVPVG